jgi:glycosyltransferase involved in cell wall biosynthesis
MLVSIIIPTYNRAHLIAETLESVANQTYKDFECLVVDDGSTDDTQAVVEEFCKKDARFTYLSRPTNREKGANACRNFGFENAKGSYVNWLDSDDLLLDSHIEMHLALHKNKPEIDASITLAGTFTETIGDLDAKWSATRREGDMLLHMINAHVNWQTATLLWKKSYFANSPFREDLVCSQEWTLHLESFITGLFYHLEDKVTVYIRRHEERIGKQVSGKKFVSKFMSRLYIYQLLDSKKRLTKEYERQLLKRMLQTIKNSIKNGYSTESRSLVRRLKEIYSTSTYKSELWKIIYLFIPIYRVTGKGERF